MMILDFQMPQLNGLQVVENVRAEIRFLNEEHNLNLKEPRFIIVSAFFSPIFKKMLARHGIVDVFEKPIQMKHITDLLL